MKKRRVIPLNDASVGAAGGILGLLCLASGIFAIFAAANGMSGPVEAILLIFLSIVMASKI